MITLKNKLNYYLFYLFCIYLFVNFYLYKDFGLSIDEPSTRIHGLVSFNYIIEILNKYLGFNFIENNSLPKLENYDFREYGVFYELLTVIIEKVLGLSEFNDIIYLKHFLNNLSFIISCIVFGKLIFKYFNNTFFSLWGSFSLYSTPRIFAQSFFNNKDLIFLSFFIFAIYFIFSFFEKKSIKNLFLASIFLALLSSVRIVGFYLLILFLFFLLVEILEDKKNKIKLSSIIHILIIYFFFLYLFFPFLWTDPISNLIYSISNMANYPWSANVFFLGEYHSSKYLPSNYLLIWIFISNPILFSLINLISIAFVTYRLFKRLLKLDSQNNFLLWQNKYEFFSYFNLAIIFTPLLLIYINNSIVYNGWRHVYFIYPSFILLSLYFISFLKLYRVKQKIIHFFMMIMLIVNIINLINYHPYQNIFFNIAFNSRANNNFEIDYWGLSTLEALNILAKNKENDVDVCNLGLIDLNHNIKMLPENIRDRFKDLGQNFQDCNYIISNNYFLTNPKYVKKYQLPKNFKKINEIKRNKILITEIYKKN